MFQGRKYVVILGNAPWVLRLPLIPGYEWGEDGHYLRMRVDEGARTMGRLLGSLLKHRDFMYLGNVSIKICVDNVYCNECVINVFQVPKNLLNFEVILHLDILPVHIDWYTLYWRNWEKGPKENLTDEEQ